MDEIKIKELIDRITFIAPVGYINEEPEIPSYMPPVAFGDDFDDFVPTADKPVKYNVVDNTNNNSEKVFVNYDLVTRTILKELLGEFIYYKGSGYTNRELDKSRLYANPELECEDLVISKMENIRFRRADVYQSTVYNSKEKRSKFSALYEFDFKKTFQNQVSILKSVDGRGIKLRKTKTLNKKFNKAFKILAVTKYDSLLVLTPNVMEYLLELNERYDGNIEFSFVDYKLYIKIKGENIFSRHNEYNFIREEKIKEFIKEIELIKDLIIYLKQIRFVSE